MRNIIEYRNIVPVKFVCSSHLSTAQNSLDSFLPNKFGRMVSGFEKGKVREDRSNDVFDTPSDITCLKIKKETCAIENPIEWNVQEDNQNDEIYKVDRRNYILLKLIKRN